MESDRNRYSIQPITLLLVIAVLIVGAVLMVRAIRQAERAVDNPDIPYPEIARVSVPDAFAAWESGEATFVDVRSKNVYDSAHVPGALSMPLDGIEGQLTMLDPQSWIITYCT